MAPVWGSAHGGHPLPMPAPIPAFPHHFPFPSPVPILFLEATNSWAPPSPAPQGFWLSIAADRQSCPPTLRKDYVGGGRKAGSPARLAPAPWAQRVTVVGLGARQVTAACLPPPLPPTNHLVIRASCIPAGMGGCHSDGGCWLPSNSHPLAHPPWTNSGHSVLPPRCRLPTLGDVHGVLWSPRWAQWGTAGVRGGFPSCGEWFPRNSLHDGPSTPRRHIDLLPLELWRPPPAWCLAGRWLTQPGT